MELQSELGNFINNEKIIIILKSINNSIKLVFSFNQGNQIFNILNIKEFLTYSRNLIETQLESRRRRSVPMTFSSYLRNRGNRNVKILLNLFNKLGTNKQNSINGLIALLNYSPIKDVLNGRSTYNQKNLFSKLSNKSIKKLASVVLRKYYNVDSLTNWDTVKISELEETEIDETYLRRIFFNLEQLDQIPDLNINQTNEQDIDKILEDLREEFQSDKLQLEQSLVDGLQAYSTQIEEKLKNFKQTQESISTELDEIKNVKSLTETVQQELSKLTQTLQETNIDGKLQKVNNVIDSLTEQISTVAEDADKASESIAIKENFVKKQLELFQSELDTITQNNNIESEKYDGIIREINNKLTTVEEQWEKIKTNLQEHCPGGRLSEGQSSTVGSAAVRLLMHVKN